MSAFNKISKIFLVFLLSLSFQVFFVSDIMATGSNGTITGATWTAGKNGGALSFNGTSDYIDVGTFYNAIQSIEFWVKADDITSHTDYVIDLNGTDYIEIVDGEVTVNNISSPTYYVNAVSGEQTIASINNWYHVVVTTATGIDASDLDIGRVDPTGFFDGKLDDIKFYNRALSAAEVRYHYNRGGPVGYWKFDEGSGTTAFDETENNNNGTWNGTGTSHWTTGKFGSAGSFVDASGDYVSIASAISNAQTLGFWVNLSTTTENIISYAATGITVSAGTITHTDWSGCYVDGISTNTIATGWHYVVLTNVANVNLTTVKLGYTDGGLDGSLDDVKIYNYVRSADEIKLDYNAGMVAHFGPITINCDTNPGACMTNGLVGHWNMDSGSGQTVYDASDSKNNGVLGANSTPSTDDPTWTSGKTAGGLEFDGAADYVDVGTSYNGVKSVEFWVKADDITSRDIIDLNGSDYIEVNGSSVILATGIETPTIYIDGAVPASPVIDTKWHHVVITTATGQNASDLDIGRREGSTFFDGKLDDIRIYNRALSATEVSYHYGQWKDVRQGLVSYWKLDEGTGDTVYDLEGRNNGTLGGDDVCPAFTGDNNCPTWTTAGKKDSALTFDGSNDYVVSSSVIPIKGKEDRTISGWLKSSTTNYSASDGYFFNFGTAGVWQYHYGLAARGSPATWQLTEGVAWYNSGISVSTSWNYVAVTHSSSDNNSRLYINGSLVFTQSFASLNTGGNTNTNLILSKYIGSSSGYFSGSIDEVRIYNRALTAGEVLNNYYAGRSAHFK